MRGRLVIHGDVNRLRSSMSFSTSACLHGLVLCWLALYSAVRPNPAARSAYDLEIRPHETHLVWYNLKKLPDVTLGKNAEKRPLRARAKFEQNVVASPVDLPAPPQLIRMAAPRIELPKMLALPNVVAVAPPPRPVRQFQAPALPPMPASPTPELFAAPELHPQAPALAAPNIPRSFQAPPAKPESPRAAPADAPPPEPLMTASVASPATLAIVGLNPARTFEPPPGSREAAFSGGPEVRPTGASEAPAESPEIAVPGLVARGGGKPAPSSLMSVFAPLARQTLATDIAAAARAGTPPIVAGSRPAHVTSAPDPRLNGRYVYTVAIQMPNVTSYSGSWIVWFADRDPATRALAADMRAPDPIRKVDPKYIQTAVEEKVQGVVRLAAVIRSDGRVEHVELLQHLDERLDRSAEEALAKWEFSPARRNGVAVDVDAVFEIPFRLAPKSER